MRSFYVLIETFLFYSSIASSQPTHPANSIRLQKIYIKINYLAYYVKWKQIETTIEHDLID